MNVNYTRDLRFNKPTRGTLTYFAGTEMRDEYGWFYISDDGTRVIAHQAGGAIYHVCDREDVAYFTKIGKVA